MSTIIRTIHNKENPYVQLNKRALWDKNLSLEAVGLWARLLSRPDDWTFSVEELCKSCGCGKAKIYGLLKELIDNGYAYRHKHTEKGKYTKHETYVFEFKVEKSEVQKILPQLTFPEVEAPDLENRYITNKERKTKEKEDQEKKSAPVPGSATPKKVFEDFSEEVQELTNILLTHVQKLKPDYKVKNLDEWKRDMKKLVSIDNRNPEEAKSLLAWIAADSFWRVNILSPEKLRKQYDHLCIKMKDDKEKRLQKENAKKNWEYAYELKGKRPDLWQGCHMYKSHISSSQTGKDLSFNMPHEEFKKALPGIFGQGKSFQGGYHADIEKNIDYAKKVLGTSEHEETGVKVLDTYVSFTARKGGTSSTAVVPYNMPQEQFEERLLWAWDKLKGSQGY